MSDTLEEKVRYILDDSDFNDLPFEERVRISRYKAEQQILTLYQVLNKDKSNTTEAWRKKTRAWLKNCVDIYYREYRYPQVEQTEPKILGKHTDQIIIDESQTEPTIKTLVDALKDSVTYEDVIQGKAEAKGYVEGFKDGLKAQKGEE